MKTDTNKPSGDFKQPEPAHPHAYASAVPVNIWAQPAGLS
jgi:hypothetical protein